MKTIIVYAGKHGTTAKCAELLAKELKRETRLCDLTQESAPDIAGYEGVIIGGSIYAGSIRKEISQFCAKYGAELGKKKLGLFVCCGTSGAAGEEYIVSQYPGSLTAHAVAKGVFGGEFLFDRMNFFERAIIRMITKSKPEGERMPEIDSKSISAFAAEWEK
jgi:menaquinone-dependent protoporphyrinogen oxidase